MGLMQIKTAYSHACRLIVGTTLLSLTWLGIEFKASLMGRLVNDGFWAAPVYLAGLGGLVLVVDALAAFLQSALPTAFIGRFCNLANRWRGCVFAVPIFACFALAYRVHEYTGSYTGGWAILLVQQGLSLTLLAVIDAMHDNERQCVKYRRGGKNDQKNRA